MSVAFMYIGGRGRAGAGRRGKTVLLFYIFRYIGGRGRREPVGGEDGVIILHIYIYGGRGRAGAGRRGKTENFTLHV